MGAFVNIAAYKFVTLSNLKQRRLALRAVCQQLQLLGTILLSEEGINLFVSGTRPAIDELLATLRGATEFSDLDVKESPSDHQPFNRMLVKIKREIVAFGVTGIDPRRTMSRRISPADLKQWLDDGRPVTLLDVRNDFEFNVGTFDNAVPARIDDFRQFPSAVQSLPASLKDQTVVTFCTGGIRCEKAAPYLEREGFRDVYQLDGGILKYFEQCGNAHFRGECFVFDKRVALDATLRETDTAQCFVCQAQLSAEDQQSPRYEYEKSCPYCFRSDEQRLSETIARRHEAIRLAVTPLPGSVAYVNERPIRVPQRLDAVAVIDFLDAIHTHLPRDEWLRAIDAGQLRIAGRAVSADEPVRAGDRLIHSMPGTIEPDVNADVRILFEDDALVVVNKPAPLPMHPCGRFNRNTLTHILREVYRPHSLRAVHRLDANTSGVVVLARSRRIAADLQNQFKQGRVEKEYLARVLGWPAEDNFFSDAPISDEPCASGARRIDPAGLAARSEFAVLNRLTDGTTLVKARPITGRTNQLRVHLWDLGLPICGDPLYRIGGKLGDEQTRSPADPPMCLHAHRITFDHPSTGQRISFVADGPNWSREL